MDDPTIQPAVQTNAETNVPHDVPPEPAAPPAARPRWEWVIAALIVLGVAYPVVRWFSNKATLVPSAADPQLLGQSLDLMNQGRLAESIALLKTQLRTAPNADLYNNLGIAYAKLQLWDDALAAIDKALALNPDFALARNNRAWVEGERAKGFSYAPPPSTPLAPTPAPGGESVEVWMSRSLEHYNAGRFAECIEAAQKALKLNPRLAAAHNNIAAAYSSMQRWDDAIRSAQEALLIDPNLALARNNLAWAVQQKANGAK